MANDFFFFELMGRFNQSYPSLFGENKQESAGEYTERVEKNGFAQQYSWHLMLDNVSNHRRELWDYYLEMNVVVFFNTLVFYKDKQDYIEFITHANSKR